MKTFSLFFPGSMIFMISFLSCQKKEKNPNPSLGRYHYNLTTGKCINNAGKEGYNPLNIAQAQLTKNCECMDLSNQDLYWLLEGSNEESHYSYKILMDYNFRGANMDSAVLEFNSIKRADLRGAKMRTLKYGYASINGRIDKYTELPIEGLCISKNDSCSCHQ